MPFGIHHRATKGPPHKWNHGKGARPCQFIPPIICNTNASNYYSMKKKWHHSRQPTLFVIFTKGILGDIVQVGDQKWWLTSGQHPCTALSDLLFCDFTNGRFSNVQVKKRACKKINIHIRFKWRNELQSHSLTCWTNEKNDWNSKASKFNVLTKFPLPLFAGDHYQHCVPNRVFLNLEVLRHTYVHWAP